MKRVNIHVGIGKTGTTSIQHMLYDNRELLLRNGHFYQTYSSDTGHHSLLTPTYDESMWPSDEGTFRRLRDDFAESGADAATISSEMLLGVPVSYIEGLRRLFAEYEVKIVVYVRDQIRHIESNYLQKQKDLFQDYRGSIEAFFDFYNHIYGNEVFFINRWANVFGNDAMIVGVYDRRLLPEGDVCVDFARKLGISEYIRRFDYFANDSIIPQLSYLISALDRNIPGLTDKQTDAFAKIRQGLIIPRMLEISQRHRGATNRKETERVLHALRTELFDTLRKLDTDQRTRIDEAFSKASVYLSSDQKFILIDDTLRKKIATHYRQQNIDFADTFLNEEEKKVFLKHLDCL